MEKTEQILNQIKKDIDELTVPAELEARLRSALTDKAAKRKPFMYAWKIRIAAGLLALLFLGYNFDAMAYYSKRLIGYDTIMNGSLKQLNSLGKGQIIDKSCVFKNGTKITLDGVMLDKNQMLVFFTAKNTKGNLDPMDVTISPNISGLIGDYEMSGGYGEMNPDKKEIKYIYSFEPPVFFQKSLTIGFEVKAGDQRETGNITFTLDRTKAMGSTLKKQINQSIAVNQTRIHFDSIQASPTKTVIKGSIGSIIELAEDQFSGERLRPGSLETKLFANEKEVPQQGSGMRTDMKGITFHQDYDPLPENLQKLQLKLVRFEVDQDVNQVLNLDKSKTERSLHLLNQQLTINKIEEKKGDTYITFTSEDSMVLSKVYLLADGKRIPLQNTMTDHQDKTPKGIVLHTRTMHFEGTGQKLQLDIKRMKYAKTYNEVIDIPVE